METGVPVELAGIGLIKLKSIQRLTQWHRLVPVQQSAAVGLLNRVIEPAEIVERYAEILS
ncbi:hypothetical protein VIMS_03869 [Mycobacterium marinum]|nr:hypothetical protein VIMS_03869 [Mycobacterium marinum]